MEENERERLGPFTGVRPDMRAGIQLEVEPFHESIRTGLVMLR